VNYWYYNEENVIIIVDLHWSKQCAFYTLSFLSWAPRKTHLVSKYGLLVKPRKPFWQVLVETKDHFAHNRSHIEMHQRTYQEVSRRLISRPFEYLDLPRKNSLVMVMVMPQIYFPSTQRSGVCACFGFFSMRLWKGCSHEGIYSNSAIVKSASCGYNKICLCVVLMFENYFGGSLVLFGRQEK